MAAAHGRAGQGRKCEIQKAESHHIKPNISPLRAQTLEIYSGVTDTASQDSEIRISKTEPRFRKPNVLIRERKYSDSQTRIFRKLTDPEPDPSRGRRRDGRGTTAVGRPAARGMGATERPHARVGRGEQGGRDASGSAPAEAERGRGGGGGGQLSATHPCPMQRHSASVASRPRLPLGSGVFAGINKASQLYSARASKHGQSLWGLKSWCPYT